MFLPTRDGIRCDICGSSHRNDFTYYSFDVNKVVADTAIGTVNPTIISESYDVCEECYNKFIDKCKKHIRDVKKNTVRCDFCPKYLSGKFEMRRIVVTKVTVDSAQKSEGPLDVESKHMDFNVCKECWSEILQRINKTKETLKQKGDWS